MRRIHAVISLSNQISDFDLLDDKIGELKHPGNHLQYPNIMVVAVAWAGSTHIFFRII